MAVRERKRIEKSLKKKGFIEDSRGGGSNRDTGHRYYYLHIAGKKTNVRTRVSVGSKYKDLDDDLLSAMQAQLKLDTKQEFLDFVDCPMSEDQYMTILRDGGKV